MLLILHIFNLLLYLDLNNHLHPSDFFISLFKIDNYYNIYIIFIILLIIKIGKFYELIHVETKTLGIYKFIVNLVIKYINKFVLKSNFWILSSDSSNKLFKADSSISIFISIINHLINLLRSKFLPNYFTSFFKVFGTKTAWSSWIKYFVEFSEWSFALIFLLSKDLYKSLEVKLFSSSGWLNKSYNTFSFAFKL